MTKVIRFDAGTLQKPRKTPQGFLRVDGWASRCGVLEYRDGKGVRRELRLPEDVHHDASLFGFEGIPVTDDHPSEMVDTENARSLTRGYVLSPGRKDGERVAVSMLVTDAALIKKLESGKKRQLSVGYLVNLDETPGDHPTYGKYDAIQRDIVPNHLAVVERGRAGESVCVRMDGALVSESDELDDLEDEDENRLDFDPDQERDESGRWGAGGGGGKAKEGLAAVASRAGGFKDTEKRSAEKVSSSSLAKGERSRSAIEKAEQQLTGAGSPANEVRTKPGASKGKNVDEQLSVVKSLEARVKEGDADAEDELAEHDRHLINLVERAPMGMRSTDAAIARAQSREHDRQARPKENQRTFVAGAPDAAGPSARPANAGKPTSQAGQRPTSMSDVDPGHREFLRAMASSKSDKQVREKLGISQDQALLVANDIRKAHGLTNTESLRDHAKALSRGDCQEETLAHDDGQARSLQPASDVPNSNPDVRPRGPAMTLEEALAEIEKLKAQLAEGKAEDAEEESAAAKEEAEKAKAEAKEAKDRADALAKDLSDAKNEAKDAALAREQAEKARLDAESTFAARVAERVALEAAASKVLADDKDTIAKLGSMTSREIKVDVVKRVDGDDYSDSKKFDDSYVTAMFDGAIKRHAKGARAVAETAAAVVQNRADAQQAHGATAGMSAEQKAAQANRDALATAWSKETK